MNFIILGDKFQKRMKSKGCVALIKTHNKTVLHHQYNIIKTSFPKAKIIYIYGFEGKRFLSFLHKNNNIYADIIPIYNINYSTKNTGYSLYLASKYLNENCMIIFGENLLHKKSFTNFQPGKESQIFINKKEKNNLGCIINKNKIENIAYDLDNYLSEIYYISKSHASILQKTLNNATYHNCFLFELINQLIDKNQHIIPRFNEYSTKSLVSSK